MPTQEDIEHVSNALQERYATIHRIHTQRGYKRTPARERQWNRIARACIENNVSADEYVSWAYNFYRVGFPVVYVNMVASPKTFTTYLQQKGDYDRRFDVSIRLQFVRLQDELNRGRALEEVLLDSELDLGVVFRYAVASRMGNPSLAARFQLDAERELLTEPRYRNALSGYLPELGEGNGCADQ